MGEQDPLTALLDGHIALARAAGAPFYVALLELMREDAAAGGPVRVALRGHEHDRIAEWDAFRILAGVHRMVLAGDADELRKHFPSTGGDGDAAAAWPAIRALIASGRAELVEALAHPLQTNAPSGDRRRAALRARGERRIPLTHKAGVLERRAGELERGGVRVGRAAHVVPIEHV
jgi:hypothetical protein